MIKWFAYIAEAWTGDFANQNIPRSLSEDSSKLKGVLSATTIESIMGRWGKFYWSGNYSSKFSVQKAAELMKGMNYSLNPNAKDAERDEELVREFIRRADYMVSGRELHTKKGD